MKAIALPFNERETEDLDRRIASQPRYQLRLKRLEGSDRQWEIWQIPSTATPHLKIPKRIAGLKGRNLALVEPRLSRQMKSLQIDLSGLESGQERVFDVEETTALRVGLLFRVLAPMRNRESMGMCATGIEAMGKEEASYWLGMALHRPNPRRVLMALRCLLTDPRER
jgi:hypothetical protein